MVIDCTTLSRPSLLLSICPDGTWASSCGHSQWQSAPFHGFLSDLELCTNCPVSLWAVPGPEIGTYSDSLASSGECAAEINPTGGDNFPKIIFEKDKLNFTLMLWARLPLFFPSKRWRYETCLWAPMLLNFCIYWVSQLRLCYDVATNNPRISMGYKNNDLFLAQATSTSWVNYSSAPCLHLDLFGDVPLWQKGERQRTIS